MTLALVGCATPGPYAEVVGERIQRADPYDEDVLVLGVDGQLDLSFPKRKIIQPGRREVMLGTVRADRTSRSGQADSGVVPLNAKACLRYYFVARHETMNLVHPWKLVLANVEPIPECVAQYPEHKPVPAKPPAPPA